MKYEIGKFYGGFRVNADTQKKTFIHLQECIGETQLGKDIVFGRMIPFDTEEDLKAFIEKKTPGCKFKMEITKNPFTNQPIVWRNEYEYHIEYNA